LAERALLLAPRALLLDPESWVEGGGVLVREGEIRGIYRSRGALRRACDSSVRRIELEDLVLGPGLLDAHVHLDLSALHGKVPARGGFVAWLRRVVRARRELSVAEVRAGARAASRELLRGGTTALGDIDASGVVGRMSVGPGPRRIVYREILDAGSPERTASALAHVRRPLAVRPLLVEGLSPHAPYTTSSELLRGAGSLARRRRLPLSIHWAETAEEQAWMERGTGPFARILSHSPRTPGLELLARAGLLGRRTSLVHGNFPGRGDPERLATVGVTLVHCPGTHAFFARPPFPLQRYRRAGVPLALGTDSAASNAGLDMRREMALLRRAFPGLDPREVYAMATLGAARALGLAGRAGCIRRGAPGDLVAWGLDAGGARGVRPQLAALEQITAGSPPAVRVWVAGRAVPLRS